MSKKTIITVALNGSQGLKSKNPSTPVSVEEIIEDAYRCYSAGAAIVHIHLKSDDGLEPEINNEKFTKIREGIREKCDIILNFSTSGEVNHIDGIDYMGTPDPYQHKRIAILDTNPEIATYDVPTMNFGERIFMNPLPFLRKLGEKSQKLGIKNEVEIFSLADIVQAERLMAEGSLDSNSFFQLCLGTVGGTPATVKNLVFLSDELPANANWSAFGVGKNHLPIMYTTLALGGHVRVGLEDNLYYKRGQLTSNVELVERAVRVIHEFGNEVATPNEAREILGIRK